jgi:hypothetical protein
VYRYDAQTGALTRVSIGEDGFNDDGNGGLVCVSCNPGGAWAVLLVALSGWGCLMMVVMCSLRVLMRWCLGM